MGTNDSTDPPARAECTRVTPEEARGAGLSAWNLRCNRCGGYGADWFPGERPGWYYGNLALCKQHAAELEAEYRRHSAALAALRAVHYEQDRSTRNRRSGEA